MSRSRKRRDSSGGKHRTRRNRRGLAYEALEARLLLTNNAGNALILDGVNDYAAAFSDYPALDLGVGTFDDFTIEASFLVPLDLTGNRVHTLVSKPGAYELSIQLNASGSDTLSLRLWENGSSTFTRNFVLQANPGWHHVAGVFDNEFTPTLDAWGLFIDGNGSFSTMPIDLNPGIFNSAAVVNVGSSAGSNLFYGAIDEVRISNSVRYSTATYAVPLALRRVDRGDGVQ